MTKWSKRWGLVASGLVGLAELVAPARAQYPGGPGAGDPMAMPTHAGSGAPGAQKESPFTLRSEGPNAFCDDDGCRPPQQPYCFTVRGEYLYWYVSEGNLSQPLVTTSTDPDLAFDRGAFGQINTATVVGAGEYDYGAVPGGRLTVGIALDRLMPLEITGFWLGRQRSIFDFQSDGTPGTAVVARPIQLSDQPQQLGLPLEDVSLVNFPGVVAGQMHIYSVLSLWDIEANLFFPCCETDVLGLAALVGYRHVNMSEALNIYTATAPVGATALNFGADPTGFTSPNTIGVTDSYSVLNRFDGGQVGVRAAITSWRLTVSTDLKLALGNTHSAYSTQGASALYATAGTITLPGGLLALPSNSIAQNQNRFSVIPEANFNLRFRLHDNISLLGGYNIFYWSSVLRAGDNIRRTLNSQEIPTDINFTPGFEAPLTPASLQSTGFFAHGINVGIEIGF